MSEIIAIMAADPWAEESKALSEQYGLEAELEELQLLAEAAMNGLF